VDVLADHKDAAGREGFKIPDSVPHLAAVYAAAQTGKTHTLNLIPWEAKSAKIKKEQRLHLVRITVLLVLALAAGIFTMNVVTIKRNWLLAQLNTEVKKSQSQIKTLQSKLQMINAVDQFLGRRLILADVVSELDGMLPPATLLTTLSVNNDRVLVLQGMSKRPSDVNMFQQALLNSGHFGNIKLDYVNKSLMADGEVSVFQITCQKN
jgi:Tfp pilus assembly protein PilN